MTAVRGAPGDRVRPSLLGRGSVYLLGTICQVAGSFLALPLLTRVLDRKAAPGISVEPVVDSLYHVWVFLGMLAAGWAPAWLVFLLFLRELTAPYIYSFARQGGLELGRMASERPARLVYAVCQIDIVALHVIYGPMAEIAGTVKILLLAALLAGVGALAHCAWAASEDAPTEG